jgi:hypothetical protein
MSTIIGRIRSTRAYGSTAAGWNQERGEWPGAGIAVVVDEGTLANIVFADLDDDSAAELVVVTQSAGSGGHLTADAFRLRHGVLARVAGVEGRAPSADPVAALRKAAAR